MSKNNESLRQDFQDWLQHPLTDTFFNIISSLKEKYLSQAYELSYKNYHKKEVNEIATLLYGKADGIETLLSVIEDCKNNKAAVEELFNQTLEENEKK